MSTNKTHETPAAKPGIPLGLFGPNAKVGDDIRALLQAKTFVGIDFGTSTTIISRIALDPASGALRAIPLPIPQYDDQGLCVEDHLVPSCLAWTGRDLLVGQGAARLKIHPDYAFEKNIWFSFKMKLGFDLGPQYVATDLSRSAGGPVIEKPRDAATHFFRYLRERIEQAVAALGLPTALVYTVSVPAAFEANQRQDLCLAVREAGIDLPDNGILDEPNAAFLSYLLETLETGAEIADSLRDRARKVLVFDFGAGTCDISILEIRAPGGRLVSRNLALSQFQALGGDNIDREIVRRSLLPQLVFASGSLDDLASAEVESRLVPRLQPVAENLKIQCCRFLAANWNGATLDPLLTPEAQAVAAPIAPFAVGSGAVSIPAPTLTYTAFAEALTPFLAPAPDDDSLFRCDGEAISVFEPILNALRKAGLEPDDLHMVLLIGGSSSNPFVQQAIRRFFGRVETVILPDLRTPVSRGAALHAFLAGGLGCEPIRPISSESIFLVTRGGGTRLLLPAGTEIPSPSIVVDHLTVALDQQTRIELPICVTGPDKLLGVLAISAPEERPFHAGEELRLTCSLDANKLLRVEAEIAGIAMAGTLMNPLANRPLSEKERRMLAARLALNQSAAENNGRPSFEAMVCFAHACAAAGQHLKAAESFAVAEKLAPAGACDFSVSICYHYSKADRRDLSDRWAETAHHRNPSPVSAFNLALTRQGQGDIAGYEALMRQALQRDTDYAPALESYGRHLNQKGDPAGIGMIERAFGHYHRLLAAQCLEADDRFRLRRAAAALGRQDVTARLDAGASTEVEAQPYSTHNLIAAPDPDTVARAEGGTP